MGAYWSAMSVRHLRRHPGRHPTRHPVVIELAGMPVLAPPGRRVVIEVLGRVPVPRPLSPDHWVEGSGNWDQKWKEGRGWARTGSKKLTERGKRNRGEREKEGWGEGVLRLEVVDEVVGPGWRGGTSQGIAAENR